MTFWFKLSPSKGHQYDDLSSKGHPDDDPLLSSFDRATTNSHPAGDGGPQKAPEIERESGRSCCRLFLARRWRHYQAWHNCAERRGLSATVSPLCKSSRSAFTFSGSGLKDRLASWAGVTIRSVLTSAFETAGIVGQNWLANPRPPRPRPPETISTNPLLRRPLNARERLRR
jgi:hypothetical protein